MDVELETWVEPTIQEEIARGEFLQKQKAISARVDNLVYVKSPRLAKGGLLNRRKSPIRKWRRQSNSPIRKRTSPSTSRDESYSSNRNPRMGRPVCSMRISELAAPTKRQCIAAWRANSNILPETMINRLKKRVTDQEPIVKVSDAVKCIKQVKRPSDIRGAVIGQNKRPAKKIPKAEMNKKIFAENQVLSDIFGRKIIPHLMKPMSITLNSRLKKVSDIISGELYHIIKDTQTLKTNKARNERIIQEISEKVTIWIARILDDSTEKLLEEELKEFEELEGPALDALDEIVDDVLHKCIRTPSDNVTPDFVSVASGDKINCPEYEEAAQGDRQDEVSETSKNKTGDETLLGDEQSNNKNEDFEDTIENDVARQINKLIDSLKHEDFHDDSRPEEPDIDVLYSKDKMQLQLSENNIEDIENNLPNIGISDTPDLNEIEDVQNAVPKTDISDTPDLNEVENVQNEFPKIDISDTPDLTDLIDNNESPLVTHRSVKSTELKVKQNQDDVNDASEDNISLASEIDDNIENLTDDHNSKEKEIANEKETSNVSDAIEVVTAELSEEQNKKVQFSKENLESMINKRDDEQQKPISSENPQSEDEQLLQDVGFENSRSNIVFASPNENLLSDADESWPDDVTATRPAASVTRSVTSMGKIVEKDERYSISLDSTENPSQRKEYTHEKRSDIDKEPNAYAVQNIETETIDNNQKKTDNLSQNESKIYVTGDEEKDHHEGLHNITEIAPHEQLEEFDKVFDLDTTHDVNVEQKYNIHETGDDEKNRHVDSHHTVDIMPLDQFAELRLAVDLDTAHDINVAQNDYVNMLAPVTLPENFANLESVVIIDNDDLQDYRNIRELQLSDVTDSVDKKRDRSKRTEHSEEGSSRGHQRRASADEVTLRKFDYRVHENTAPSWIRRGQGEPTEPVQTCACRPFRQPAPTAPFPHPTHPDMNRMEEREQEIRKWCQELDFILKNLDNWKNWLNYVSKYITGLKQKADGKEAVWESRHRSRRTVDRLIRSFSPTDNDRWRKLNTEGLKQRKHDDAAKYKISPSTVRYCKKCGRRKPSQPTKRHQRHSRYQCETRRH